MTSTLQPGLTQALTWGEWFLMLAVFILLIMAGWAVIGFFRTIFEVMRGE